jgi:hypothetical protein
MSMEKSHVHLAQGTKGGQGERNFYYVGSQTRAKYPIEMRRKL